MNVPIFNKRKQNLFLNIERLFQMKSRNFERVEKVGTSSITVKIRMYRNICRLDILLYSGTHVYNKYCEGIPSDLFISILSWYCVEDSGGNFSCLGLCIDRFLPEFYPSSRILLIFANCYIIITYIFTVMGKN